MNLKTATLPELITIAFHESDMTRLERHLAAEEIVERMRDVRKPYRKNQMKIRREYPR